jgi:hypothetical protein
MHRKIAPVAQTTVATDLHHTLDVHLNFTPEITLHAMVPLDNLTQQRNLGLG